MRRLLVAVVILLALPASAEARGDRLPFARGVRAINVEVGAVAQRVNGTVNVEACERSARNEVWCQIDYVWTDPDGTPVLFTDFATARVKRGRLRVIDSLPRGWSG